MKTGSTKSRSKKAPSNADLTASSRDHRHDHIATAAYYKAEARGFSPGNELSDWLEAEMEIGRMA